MIALGTGVVCLIIRNKRIAINSGNGKPVNKKEEEDSKASDKELM